jgi:hypothetical protein
MTARHLNDRVKPGGNLELANAYLTPLHAAHFIAGISQGPHLLQAPIAGVLFRPCKLSQRRSISLDRMEDKD